MRIELGRLLACALVLGELSEALVAPQRPGVLARRPLGLRQGPLFALRPLDKNTFERLTPAMVSKEQWLHFWGNNDLARASRIFEITLVSFFGLWATWFLTFVLGTVVGTLMCFIFLFWGMIAPYSAALRRNADFRNGILDGFLSWHPKRSLYVALYSGRIIRCERVVADFKGRRFMLKLDIEDEEGRVMKVRAPLLEAHADVREGQQTFALLVSEDPDFVTLERASDVFIPSVPTWAGEYPFVRWERLPLRKSGEARSVEPQQRERFAAEPWTEDALPNESLQR